MFENQTELEIKQRMLSKVPAGINTGEGDFFNDAMSPAVIELTLAYQQLDHILDLGFADTSYGEYLDRITSERGVYRKPATKGTGRIEICMAVGSQITKGDALTTWQGNIRFVAAETKLIGETGKAEVSFENAASGNQGNILPGTTFIAPVAIPGFISAKNLQQINAGTEQETDNLLRQRYFEKIQTPSTSGNQYHYRNWAEEVPGVGDAKVLPLWNGASTVKVVIIDSNKQPASTELIQQVKTYIDPEPGGSGGGQAPIGAYCTVVSAQGIPVNVIATISGANVQTVKSNFEALLKEYLASIAFTDTAVSYAKIGTVLLDSISLTGGADYTGLTVNDGIINIPVATEQVAVKGTVTLYEQV